MTDLNVKNCPFCGGEAQYDVSQDGIAIVCTVCHCQTARLIDAKGNRETSNTAIYAVTDFWNRRDGK